MRSTNDLHILLLPSFYPVEANRLQGAFFRDQALALRRLGFRVGVVYPDVRSLWRHPRHALRSLIPAIDQEVDEGVATLRARGASSREPGPWERWVWLAKAMKLYDTYVHSLGKPDVIHAHSSIWGGAAAHLIWRRHGVPYVLTEHRGRFIANPSVGSREMRETHHPLAIAAFEDARTVITVSRKMQPYIEGLAPGARGRLTCIPNMVNTTVFHPAERPSSREPFRLVSVGNLQDVKGFDTLLEAFAKLRSQRVDARLRIIGEGPRRARLEQLARRLDVWNDVAFVGGLPRADVAEELRNADAFVLASRYEAFGVALIESLACGIPIVATHSGGPEDIVCAENGLLVPPERADLLAEAILDLIRHYDRYDRATIRRDAVANYSEETIAAKVAEVLMESACFTSS